MGNAEVAQEQNTETPTWYYQAPADDNNGVGGNGDVPEWLKVDKYKSVEEQAKAYPELASRFGGFESAPEEYAIPEGLEEDSLDTGMIDIVKGLGKDYNMSQTMFDDLITKVNSYQSEQMEASTASAKEALGENADQRIANVNDWLNVNAPKEMVEIIAPMGTSAEAIQAIEWFIDKSKGSKVADQNTQPTEKMSQSEYSDMLMARDKHGNLKISIDPEYKAKIDKLTLDMQR
jgi:hypothetical protein